VEQVWTIDGEVLWQQILGLPKADAEVLLSQYGAVDLVLWPDWVSSVPGLEQRVTLTVAEPAERASGRAPVPSG
jgi:hypothetical protein